MSGALAHLREPLLKEASQLLVADLGGIEPAAERLDRGKSSVGRYVNRAEGDRWLSINDAARLEVLARVPFVTRALCRLNGGVFVRLPAAPGCDDAIPMQMLRLTQEVGEASGRLSVAMADGRFEAGEAAAVLKEIGDIEEAAATLRAMVEAKKRILRGAERGAEHGAEHGD